MTSATPQGGENLRWHPRRGPKFDSGRPSATAAPLLPLPGQIAATD